MQLTTTWRQKTTTQKQTTIAQRQHVSKNQQYNLATNNNVKTTNNNAKAPKNNTKARSNDMKKKKQLEKKKIYKITTKKFEKKMRLKHELEPLYKVAILFIRFEVAMFEWLLGLNLQTCFLFSSTPRAPQQWFLPTKMVSCPRLLLRVG